MNYDDNRRLSNYLQKKILGTKTEVVIRLGFVFILAASVPFLFFKFNIGNSSYVSVADLIVKHNLVLPTAYMGLYLVSFLCLLVRDLPDRFRIITLCSSVGVFVFWSTILEVGSRFPYMVDRNYPVIGPLIVMVSFCAQMGCIMIFGLESMKTEPVYGIFKFTRRIGAFIQQKFDTREKKLRKLTGKQRQRGELWGMVVFGAICCSVGTGVLVVDHLHKRWSVESVRWTVTDGLVVCSEIVPAGESGDKIDVRFTYDVGDTSYTSHCVVFGLDDWATVKQIQQKFLRDYPLGKSVKVYYDPSWPARCTLLPGMYYDSLLSKIVLACFAIVGFILVIVGFFKLRKRRVATQR